MRHCPAAYKHLTSLREKERAMSCHQLIENRKQVNGAIGLEWGKPTGDSADHIAGKRDIPPRNTQARHGTAQEQAEKESTDCGASERRTDIPSAGVDHKCDGDDV
jgi:uncharacterized protein YjbJ (UPF0337 family)